MVKYVSCKHCNHVFEFYDASNSNSNWYITCPKCKGNFDIDINDYIIPNGTLVKLPNYAYGIVDGNDSENTERFVDINYYVCPLEYVKTTDWSDKYEMYLHKDLSQCVIPLEGVQFVLANKYSLFNPFDCTYVSTLKHEFAGKEDVLGFSDLEHAICFNTITEVIEAYNEQPEWARKKCRIIPITATFIQRKLLHAY